MQRLTFLAIAFCVLPCSAQTPLKNAQRAVETTLLDDLPAPEVAVPAAPIAFSGDGKRFLCYELLITNTDSTPVCAAAASRNKVALDRVASPGSERREHGEAR
jgi:hypothetical protein